MILKVVQRKSQLYAIFYFFKKNPKYSIKLGYKEVE